jgi:hypothetical protein
VDAIDKVSANAENLIVRGTKHDTCWNESRNKFLLDARKKGNNVGWLHYAAKSNVGLLRGNQTSYIQFDATANWAF